MIFVLCTGTDVSFMFFDIQLKTNIFYSIWKHSPLSILTATVRGLLGFSLSIPMASAITTCPKQPSPNGFPSVSLQQNQQSARDKTHIITVLCCSLQLVTHLVRENSHLGSEGSSSSETLASMGPSLDDRRAIRTNGVFEFMEELDSKDTCLGKE